MSLTSKGVITLNSMPSAAAYCWQKKERGGEAMRKRILSEEIVQGRLQTIDEQLLRLEDD